jgi:prepilin-type processing-associated H-X9-DG protein
LLVVIAVIAILAALLFPVFARAREKARSASCLSNIKQLAIASTLYGQDYDETFPSLWFWNPYGMKRHSKFISPPEWTQEQADQGCQTCSYTKNTAVYFCPSANNNKSYGYAHPQMIGEYVTVGDLQVPLGSALADFDQPATTIMLGDSGRWKDMAPMRPEDNDRFSMPDEFEFGYPYIYRPYTNNTSAPRALHNKMANFAFVDGHAKALRPEATVAPIDMWLKQH